MIEEQSNSNILEGTPSNGKIITKIGEFIISEKITSSNNLSINSKNVNWIKLKLKHIEIKIILFQI